MIYLDNNATTPLSPNVREAMLPFLGSSFGNPSSAHAAGREARKFVEKARMSVAGLFGADPSEIVFTSGGTESDNMSIMGALAASPDKKHIVTTRVEHEAVRKLCEKLEREGTEVSWLDVDENGELDLERLRQAVRSDTAIVSVMLANNETGILFPVDKIAEIVKERSKALVHVDGVNAVGKIAIDLSRGSIDLFSVSAHKFHGPKGIGALYIRQWRRSEPHVDRRRARVRSACRYRSRPSNCWNGCRGRICSGYVGNGKCTPAARQTRAEHSTKYPDRGFERYGRCQQSIA